MSVVFPDVGERKVLRWAISTDGERPANLVLRLFKNDYFPERGSVTDNFEEATFAGYATVDLTWPEWAFPVTLDGVAYTFWGTALVQFGFSATEQTVYGYYVTDPDDDATVWAERFPNPIPVSPTVQVSVQPFVRLHSEDEPLPPVPPP